MQSSGLEWLFRLAKEPRRLWRRYFYLNSLYCIMIALQAFGMLSLVTSVERAPREEMNYL